MANLNELKDALLHTLASKGSLGQIKARIRSEIFSALDQADDSAPKPPLSNTNLLINEMIREYLAFNQYRYSLNVFLPESNQPEVPPFDRAFISKELHVQENQHSVQIPLLYSIIALLQQNQIAPSSSGVSMIDSPSHSAPVPTGPLASSLSSSSSTQPGQPIQAHSQVPSQRQSAPARSVQDPDAPRPMHFINRS